MSPVVHSPLCSMFHLIKNQNKLNSFLSHLYCFYFDRNIETLLLFEEFETWNEAFLCWYGIKDNHGQSTSFLKDFLPSTETYFTHHKTPRVHQLFFVSSIGVNLDFLKTFWKVDVDRLASFSQLEILKWLLGFEHFLIQEPGVFVYRLDSI